MSARIVVADDDRTILSLLMIALGRDGYEPVTAGDGAEALREIREHRPDLVIIDAMMPVLSGYEVCVALRDDQDGPKPHIIMLTAGGRESDRERAHEAGVHEFMTKPFSPSELRTRVRAILGD